MKFRDLGLAGLSGAQYFDPMYQTFDSKSEPELGPARLTDLQAVMRAEGLDAYIIPHSDQYQGEYLAPRDERLAWLTGFTGSAGFCVALADRAGVFVDGRYRVQVRSETRAPFVPVDWPETSATAWIKDNLPKGIVGFDPWLHTVADIDTMTRELTGTGITLRPCDNLIDRIWIDRPAPVTCKAFVHPIDYAGRSHTDKCRDIAHDLRTARDTAAVLTMGDGICWLLNIRGSDIVHNPVIQAYAIIHDSGCVDLFVDAIKVTDVMDHLGDQVVVHSIDTFLDALAALTGQVRITAATLPRAAYDQMIAAGITLRDAVDPTVLPKARKNKVELDTARECHLRDAAHMCEFLCWLDAQNPDETTEIDVAIGLENIRRRDPMLMELSFDTISASGPHAALPHYRVTTATNRTLRHGEVMLVDSGGQYMDGTTDITRTVAIGDQPLAVKQAFTRVLQGVIAISRLRFPRGIEGRHIDILARQALWSAGQDFAHGTGHGVGHFLCVHEGPQGISRKSAVPLETGMIVSNEPGFYQEGSFGIRIENLIVVRQSPDFQGFLEFETLTYVPIDRRMICVDMLSEAERIWINDYHKACRDNIEPRLSQETSVWFARMTAPL